MASQEVTVWVTIFAEMNESDGTRGTAARMSKRKDKLLAYAKDPKGFFHQEINHIPLNLPASAIDPYLPVDKMWWFYPEFMDHDDMNSAVNLFERIEAKDPFITHPKFEVAIHLFSHSNASEVSGFKITSVVPHENAKVPFDRKTVINLDNERMVFFPFAKATGAKTNPEAKSMEEWLSSHPDAQWLKDNHVADDGATYAISSAGNKVVQRASSDFRIALACGYDLIIDNFSAGFAKTKSKPKDKTGKIRYKTVIIDRSNREKSYKWLWSFFHSTAVCRSCKVAHGTDNDPFDPTKMGLTLRQIHAFFQHFSLRLIVMDISGRVDHDSSFLYKGNLNENLHPHTTWTLQHNNHLFLLDQGVTSLTNRFSFKTGLIHFPLRSEPWNLDPERERLPPSSHTMMYRSSQATPTQFIESMEKFAAIKTKVPIPDTEDFYERLDVVVPANLWLVLSEIITKCQYEPRVVTSGNAIMSISLRLDGVTVNIRQPDSPPGMLVPYIPTEANFNEYSKHDQILKDLLRNKQTLSTYSPSVLMAMDALECSPLIFGRPQLVNGIARDCETTCYDINKAYTSFLMSIKVLPVFNSFDEIETFSYEPSPPIGLYVPTEGSVHPAELLSDYDLKVAIHQWEARGDSQPVIRQRLVLEFGCEPDRMESLLSSPAERHAFYLVQCMNYIDPFSKQFLLLDQEFCLLTYENWLIVRDWPSVKTIGILRPSQLVEVDLASPIAAMWCPSPDLRSTEDYEASFIPVALKKFLVNKAIGMCGKKFNKKSSTMLFKDKAEADKYAEIISGEISAGFLTAGKVLYIVSDERKVRLCDGFYFTQHIVYNKQRKALYDIASLPQTKDKQIMAVKTDAIWFRGITEDQVPKDNSFSGIGSYEITHNKKFHVSPPTIKQFKEVDMPEVKGIDSEGVRLVFVSGGPPIQEITINDEFDAEEFSTVFSENNLLLVKGVIPGAGKTYALKAFCRKKGLNKCLIVTPWNALADENRIEGFQSITFYKLIGLRLSGEAKTSFDISEIEVIVFDEVFLYDPFLLSKLRSFVLSNLEMENGTKRLFFAAGDPNQNKPIFNMLAQGDDAKDYYRKAVSSIFPNQITLKVCKRVKFKNPENEEEHKLNETQRTLLTEIRDLVLNSDMPLSEIARHYFKPVKTLEDAEGMAVCYLNKTASIVNNYKQATLVKGMPKGSVKTYGGKTFYVGQRLCCRKYKNFRKKDTPNLYVNYTYVVTEVGREGLKIKGTDGTEHDITYNLERTHFTYNHAHTCHSIQGSTATEGITIFDLDCWFITRDWFYTALTRANDLDKVFYFDGDLGSRPIRQNEFIIGLKQKIQGHRYADMVANRPFEEEDYVTAEDILALIMTSTKCCFCGKDVQMSGVDDEHGDQYSLDRINNDLPHTKDNVRLSCLACNKKRSDRED